MADESLIEPLVADQEGFEFQFDEALLKELAALDAAEAGGEDGQPAEHVEDEDVYKMKELIREKPKDVIQYLEEEGVVKLGEFQVQDAVAFRAFGKDNLLTMGTDHYEVDWEAMWRERLSEYTRAQEVKSALGWSTKVTLEAHVVNLRDAAAEGSKGLLHPLLKRFHAHGCSATVFGLPAVQAVIHFKWTNWARTFLLYELACYCVWLAAFTAFTLLFQAEDWTMTFWESLQDRYGFFAIVSSLMSLLPMSCFLYMELCTIAAYGWGWLRAWNIMDMASYILQVVICILHLQRSFVDEGWFSVLVATQQVLLWMKLHYFAKAFNPTKNTIVDTVRIVVEDMKWFLVFLTLTMIGFGLAFFALFRQDRQFVDFANIWHSFASMFSYMLAMFDLNVLYGSTNPTAAMLLFVAFEFVMNVLLLNVLIASMTNSFSRITQDEGLRLLHSKAEIIDELEATLPSWVRSITWYPAFVHILKIHPDATYEVSLNSVWSGIGLMENNLLGAQQETRLRVEELEDRVSKLHKKLDVLIKLFISSMGPSQAMMLSRQATMHAPPFGTAAAGGIGSSSIRSSFHAASPSWQGRSGPLTSMPPLNLNPATSGGPLHRHAATLTQLPEQLAAVSGPLFAPSVHLGAAGAASGHHGSGGAATTGQDRALARRSGPPGMWHSGPLGAFTPERPAGGGGSASIGNTGSIGRSAALAHSGDGGGSAACVQSLFGADEAGPSSRSSGLRSVGSGHMAALLAGQQALQPAGLAATGYGGIAAAHLLRARAAAAHHIKSSSSLTRSHSL